MNPELLSQEAEVKLIRSSTYQARRSQLVNMFSTNSLRKAFRYVYFSTYRFDIMNLIIYDDTHNIHTIRTFEEMQDRIDIAYRILTKPFQTHAKRAIILTKLFYAKQGDLYRGGVHGDKRIKREARGWPRILEKLVRLDRFYDRKLKFETLLVRAIYGPTLAALQRKRTREEEEELVDLNQDFGTYSLKEEEEESSSSSSSTTQGVKRKTMGARIRFDGGQMSSGDEIQKLERVSDFIDWKLKKLHQTEAGLS